MPGVVVVETLGNILLHAAPHIANLVNKQYDLFKEVGTTRTLAMF